LDYIGLRILAGPGPTLEILREVSCSSVTICSGLYLFIGIPVFLKSEFSLTPLIQKFRHRRNACQWCLGIGRTGTAGNGLGSRELRQSPQGMDRRISLPRNCDLANRFRRLDST